MVHLMACETIWNYRDNFENKDAKWCISTVFETIWNCREKKKKKKTVNCDFWRYLKRFWTAEIILKQGRFRVHYDTFWNDIWNSYEKNSTCFDFIKGGVK